MEKRGRQGELFSAKDDEGSDGRLKVINDRCIVRTEGEMRVVVVSGVALAQYGVGDRMAQAHAMVQLVEQGFADQNDVARAFGCTARSVRRYQRRFEEGGLGALGRKEGFPSNRSRQGSRQLAQIIRWKEASTSNREIARRLGINEKAVRKKLRRARWREPSSPQGELRLEGADPNLSAFPSASTETDSGHKDFDDFATIENGPAGADLNLSAFSSEPCEFSLDTDPADRRMDRLLAALGLLDDAAPMFRSELRVPRAGVLLAIPVLIDSGVFTVAREIYGSIGPAFYGLRTTLVALLLMALLRIKRPEALKEHSPVDLGRLLGLDRAPEVKTLRRKLARLASLGKAAEFGRALAELRVKAREASVGFLYIDGHVRVYNGKHPLPKAHVARRRLAMPATSDYWVNDAVGDPLFVVTAEANAALTRILPELLSEIRTVLGKRRLTVVFDRGGFSPKLFQKMIAMGIDLLTYRKGRIRRVPRGRFAVRRGKIDGRKLKYTLADQEVRLFGGKLRLRQVTRLTDSDHQTTILTTRRDLSALEVAFRMFERWRQENFFKYLREEYALDALVEYAVDDADPERDVPNPRRHKIAAQLREARAALAEARAHYGQAAFTNPEQRHSSMRGFKIAHSEMARVIRLAETRIRNLEQRQRRTPARVPVAQLVAGRVVKLAPERQHLVSLIKMIAYQAESDMVRLLQPHYRRTEDEGRTLLQTALQSVADLTVTDGTLHVALAPLSSPHRSRAIAALCEYLNRTPVLFPGSPLRLTFEVRALPTHEKADNSKGG